MDQTNGLKLGYFSDEHIAVLNSFELPSEQVQFTSLPSNYMKVLEGQYRIVIINHKEPVGFFILHATDRVKEYSDNPQAMLLTALSINRVQQGKGYGKQAMQLLKEFVKKEFRECNEIVLGVNHKNIAAQNLYVKAGFHDTGRKKFGPIGEQYIMSILV